jgi:UDP-N-acetylglucosamine--dolichyl-phosphate N-acetylglucosaminephosphotransferase
MSKRFNFMSVLSLVLAVIVAGEHATLAVSCIMSLFAGWMTFRTLPRLKDTFIKVNLSGKDVLKKDKPLL